MSGAHRAGRFRRVTERLVLGAVMGVLAHVLERRLRKAIGRTVGASAKRSSSVRVR